MNRTHPHTTDALTIGETMVMVTPQEGGRLDAESSFVLRPGGAESNVAALLAELGHPTHWAGALGTDRLGDIVTTVLSRHGVDTSLVRRDPHRPTAVYFKDPTPQGTQVAYYRGGSAATGLSTADLPAWTSLSPRVVHLSGVLPALSPSCAELTRHIVFDRPWPNTPVSFDVNHRPVLWQRAGDGPPAPGERAADTLYDLAQHSDIVFVGRDEAADLWGTTDAESVRALIDKPEHLIVKDAAVEAVSFTGAGTVRMPSRRVRVVDPVGAGDAFAAGWLSGWLHGQRESLRLGLGHYAASRVLASASDLTTLPAAGDVITLLEDESGSSSQDRN
ncbi:sugar kinase [Streptomyces luomodiensis]|uniref:Sugar kinase n=1 Tax=Streptomyces luomodiensis TaxID=3026192 RepID=A0ABY9UNJ3_9ACTN|nr:sugar kinase [Streptomyces sp. SCA4-21]WNE94116.1 sugar kinase [Streptomyces sp. SCA4-21]